MSSTINIASYLPVMAAKQPDTLAVAFPLGRDGAGKQQYLRWSYQQLEEESNAIARGLEAIGITRGMRTVLMVKPSPEFFALVFAIFKIGAVLVGVDPGMGVKNLKTCLAEAQPEAFIGIRKAHIARRLLGWAKHTNRINVLVGRKLLPFGSTISLNAVRQRGLPASHNQPLAPILADTQPEETAAILFTSGSTGIPKGVVYTHANFDAQVTALRDQYQITPGEIDLCTFPLFALYAPALGMSAIVPKMDFTKPGSVNFRNIIEPVRDFGVTNLFGSPALLMRVGMQSYFKKADAEVQICLRSLKRVISAGAPVPDTAIRGMKVLIPEDTQVFTPYGATESLPVCSIGSDEILRETAALTDQGKGVCVGRPVRSIDVKIIRITDDAIQHWSPELELCTGQIGEITVRGPQVTRSYFNRDQSTRLAKINMDAGSFYHRMGDLGYFDDEGRIWFCGRKSERVITEDRTYYTAICEGVFNAALEIPWTALVGVRLKGKVCPVICIQDIAYYGHTGRRGIPDFIDRVKRIADKHDVTRLINSFLLYPYPFPTDIRHNSKINRPLLAKWAAKKLGGQPA